MPKRTRGDVGGYNGEIFHNVLRSARARAGNRLALRKYVKVRQNQAKYIGKSFTFFLRVTRLCKNESSLMNTRRASPYEEDTYSLPLMNKNGIIFYILLFCINYELKWRNNIAKMFFVMLKLNFDSQSQKSIYTSVNFKSILIPKWSKWQISKFCQKFYTCKTLYMCIFRDIKELVYPILFTLMSLMKILCFSRR